MADDLTPLEALGRDVEKGLSAYSVERQRAVDTARREFLRAALQRRERPRRGVGYALIAAAVLAVVVGGFVFGRTRPLAFTADGKATMPETWIAAPSTRAVAVAFSDGTALRLEPASRARVVAIDEHGASIALENGAVHAEVVHTPKSVWRVIAGPLVVHVTGTRFDLRWLAATEEFSVTVTEGSVAVAGSALERTQSVRAGETLRVAVAERRFELANGGERRSLASAAAPLALPEPRLEEKPDAAAAATAPSAVSSVSDAAVRDDWRELARRGLLRKAFAVAEAGDFELACRTATPAELLELGDAARLSGRADRANQALLALRSRYPGDPRRSAAAFALGKVAFDQLRAYAQAAEWFATSIREKPSGSLAREASGRLIEAYRSAGNATAAERAARDYLVRYPDGPHADVARGVVRSSRSP